MAAGSGSITHLQWAEVLPWLPEKTAEEVSYTAGLHRQQREAYGTDEENTWSPHTKVEIPVSLPLTSWTS